MGVSVGLGIPPAYTAGAVTAGALFGDKLSPLSDTTVMASAVAEVNIFDHIKIHASYNCTFYISISHTLCDTWIKVCRS